MKTEEETELNVNVPADMLFDILAILVKEQVKYEIIEIMRNRSLTVITVYYDKKLPRDKAIVENIETLLQDYDDYRTGEVENLNWRGE